MMKHKTYFLVILFSLSIIGNVKSQVTLTDTAFVDWLKTHGYNQCISEMTLDTTCSEVTSVKNLSFTFTEVHNIFGIQYFKNLDTLICQYSLIDSITYLPSKLKYLGLSSNRITRILYFPDSLRTIGCFQNKLTYLPSLPLSLTYLDCGANYLDVLPTLPDSIIYLDCSGNELTSLPTFTKSLYDINCSFNNLTSVPELPDSLRAFNCSSNPDLRCLPVLTNISILIFTVTDVACVPNYGRVGISYPKLDTVPLCDSINPHGCGIVASILDTESISLGIFPNPTTGQLNITANFQPQTIAIYDINGRRLVQARYAPQVEVGMLTSGIYFIEIAGGDKVVRRKFVKE